MKESRQPLFIGVETVMLDLGVSRAKAYEVIKELNAEMKQENPRAIVVTGKVNRSWYETCLRVASNQIEKEKSPSGKGLHMLSLTCLTQIHISIAGALF